MRYQRLYQRRYQNQQETSECCPGLSKCAIFLFIFLFITLMTQCYKPVCFFNYPWQTLHSFSNITWSFLPFNLTITLLIAQFLLILMVFYCFSLCANSAKSYLSFISQIMEGLLMVIVGGLNIYLYFSGILKQLAQIILFCSALLIIMAPICIIVGYLSQPFYKLLQFIYRVGIIILIAEVLLPQFLIGGIRSYYEIFLILILRPCYQFKYYNNDLYYSVEKLDHNILDVLDNI